MHSSSIQRVSQVSVLVSQACDPSVIELVLLYPRNPIPLRVWGLTPPASLGNPEGTVPPSTAEAGTEPTHLFHLFLTTPILYQESNQSLLIIWLLPAAVLHTWVMEDSAREKTLWMEADRWPSSRLHRDRGLALAPVLRVPVRQKAWWTWDSRPTEIPMPQFRARA